MEWEYKREIMPMGYINYEAEMKGKGWIWDGNCMTKEGMLYLWKRKKTIICN